MILAILQARCSSTRLPGKVLKPILGEPMLVRQIERLRHAKRIDRLLVATSVDSSDDPLAAVCERHGISCFRGSLDDVLDRFYRAALPYRPEHVVRLTGDCPLTDPAIIDAVIALHLRESHDYSSSAIELTFPDGLDAEIMRFACLEQVWREAELPSEREHVTLFIYRRPERYRIGSYKGVRDLSHYRWTVDEPEDFEFVTRIYERLYSESRVFGMDDILALLESDPALAVINAGIERNAGLKKSLEKDMRFCATR
ncbi:MAG: glycosyltransferase family protein [Candidatus Competibacter sp.]|nr:glycosyltransferase family protein [Candidatus Competibacter sp.]